MQGYGIKGFQTEEKHRDADGYGLHSGAFCGKVEVWKKVDIRDKEGQHDLQRV